MQICTIYVFSQETSVRGTIYNKVFLFMVLKEWSKDAVKYSQQVLSNNTRKMVIIAVGHTAKCLCKLVLSYSFGVGICHIQVDCMTPTPCTCSFQPPTVVNDLFF